MNWLETILILKERDCPLILSAIEDFRSLFNRSIPYNNLTVLPNQNGIGAMIVLSAKKTNSPNVFQLTFARSTEDVDQIQAFVGIQMIKRVLINGENDTVFIAQGYRTFINEFGQTWICANQVPVQVI